MKKIAIQQLAQALGLSRVTVWKVLNSRPGVSPTTARRVLEAARAFQKEAGDGIFDEEDRENTEALGTSEAAGSSKPFRVQNVTLLVAHAESSSFWVKIVEQISNELSLLQIRIRYLPVDIMLLLPSEIPAMITPELTDGVIVINIYDEKIIAALQSVRMPKVFFDTIPGHTSMDLQGDLFYLDGRNTIRAITEEMAQRGCRRIGFIGDIQYAYTNLLRWEGFLEGMERTELEVDKDICLTGSIDRKYYHKSIQAFLSRIEAMPDAFVCASDYVAFVTLNLLDEQCFKVPEDVLLSGYDDSREFLLDYRKVTTVRVQKTLLGKRMVKQLLYRIENPQADFEEIKITPKIVYRD